MNVEDLEFKELLAKDMPYYNSFYELRDNKTCDSVSLESFIWKDYYNVKLAIAKKDNKDVGIIWLMSFDEGNPFSAMPICSTENLEYCFELSVEYFNKILNKKFKIHLADEAGVDILKLNKDKFIIKEEEELKDYIYMAERMRTLSGKKLHKKKNLCNNFMKSYEGRYIYRKLSCNDRDDIFKFLDKWRAMKGMNVEKHLDPEVLGIHEILLNCKNLNIHMSGVYIDNNLEAFTIGSFNKRHNMSVVHIEKANPEIIGLYQFINREFQINEFPKALLVNREDDLGIEGLRKAKKSYDPSEYARKYYIEQK